MLSELLPYMATSVTAFAGGAITTALTRTAVESHRQQRAQRRALRAFAEAHRSRKEAAEWRHRVRTCPHHCRCHLDDDVRL